MSEDNLGSWVCPATMIVRCGGKEAPFLAGPNSSFYKTIVSILYSLQTSHALHVSYLSTRVLA